MYKILSVGGSIIVPKDGFNILFLKKFKTMILRRVARGERFILVAGGGRTAREYIGAARALARLNGRQLDEIGILGTKINAHFLRYVFDGFTPVDIVNDPTKKLSTTAPIIIASGWKPGCSSDYDAVLLAKTYGVKEVFNLSNIEYVYDKDPAKYKNAKKIEKISWAAFRRDIVGNKWKAGKNAPFDPVASRAAEKLGLKVYILKGGNLAEVGKALDGKKFKGTIIARRVS